MVLVLTTTTTTTASPTASPTVIRPIMGWSALYGAPFNRVNETIVTQAALGLNRSGLLGAGYTFVNLDDWYAQRSGGASGKITADPATFPSGMAATAAAVHAAGCKFGVYSAASMRTCGNRSASLFNEVNDAATFVHDWQIDYLKYDSCLYSAGMTTRGRYLAMARALQTQGAAAGRRIVYSVEGWSPEQADPSWAPAMADSWRTGMDIWPHWDNNPNCVLNNLYATNAAARWHVPGGGVNDPDMLQPPNTLVTVLKPGLAPEEAYSQFKLWVLMKAPLILGVNWAQLADLPRLEPTYFALLTNPELLAVNQDLSPQATLVRQFPSAAQQQGRGFSGPSVPVSLQDCGSAARADQRWAPGPSRGSIALANTSLCLEPASLTAAASNVSLVPCAAVASRAGASGSNGSVEWALLQDNQIHVGTNNQGRCLTAPATIPVPATEPSLASVAACIYTGPLPPPLAVPSFATQAFVWDSDSGQIVAGASGACLTAGLPNRVPGARGWVTNNGTLEHEVWMGDLTPSAAGAPRRVVALFNKGAAAETLAAPAVLLRSGGMPANTPIAVRDVVHRQDRPAIPPSSSPAAGADLSATVPAHGVAVFVLTFGGAAGATSAGETG